MKENTKLPEKVEDSAALKNAVADVMRNENSSAVQMPASIKAKCPDCDVVLEVPSDTAKGEIISCPGCGLELEVKEVRRDKVDLQEMTLEGEDWGE